MISQKDIESGDKVLVNWDEYKKWYVKMCGAQNWRLNDTVEKDCSGIAENVFYHDGYKAMAATLSIDGMIFNIPLRFLHKIY